LEFNVFQKFSFAVIALIVASVFLNSCSEDVITNPTSDQIEAVYDVEYQDNATVFDEKDSGVLIAADTSTGTHTYDASYFDTEPQQGDVIVVAGTSMRKVKSVLREGGHMLLRPRMQFLRTLSRTAPLHGVLHRTGPSSQALSGRGATQRT
jgi:hypothetical protein